VWVTDVFPAREAPLPGVDGELVARAVEAAGGQVTYHAALDGLAAAIAGATAAGDLVLTLGAGSVEQVGSEVLRELGAVHA
jgi:UDP-N-acetylmuramate--alanine ligase